MCGNCPLQNDFMNTLCEIICDVTGSGANIAKVATDRAGPFEGYTNLLLDAITSFLEPFANRLEFLNQGIVNLIGPPN